MSINAPIIVDGTTPVVSINVGNYDNGPIIVYLRGLSELQTTNPAVRPGMNFTIRNADGVTPGQRLIYVSTYNGDNPDFSVKFSDGTDTYILGTRAGDNFVATIKDDNTWLKEVTVIQGQNLTMKEDLVGYNLITSSMTTSSFSTVAPIFVNGSSIFYGPLIGLVSPTFITSVSTLFFATDILYTSTLRVLGGITTNLVNVSTANVTSTINNRDVSTISYRASSTFTSSVTLIDTRNPQNTANLFASTNSMFLTYLDKTYVYQTLEQSGFSNISTQIAPTLNVNTIALPVSSLNTIVTASLPSTRFDPGLSSFSTSIRLLLDELGTNFGLANMQIAFNLGISTMTYAPGLSSLLTTTLIGLSTVAALPGASNVSTIISQSLSTNNVVEGLSSISTLISPGVSSISAFVPISSLSTAISLSISTVNATEGVQNLFTVVNYALSSVAVNTGVYNLSSIFSYGVSSIAVGPGLSSLSSVLFSTASTFQSGSVLSTLSTSVSYGLSTLASVEGYSSIVRTLVTGLSSIVDYGYIQYTLDVGRVVSTSMSETGTSTLLRVLQISLSTISDGPGLSSISSFFPISLSTITIAPGLSSLSNAISYGISSVVTKINFPPTYSAASTFVSSLFLLDEKTDTYSEVQIKGEDLYLSTLQYPSILNYINSSTISTQVLEVKGLIQVSSIITSSMNVPTSVSLFNLDTKTTTVQSTLTSSIHFIDYSNGDKLSIIASNTTLYLESPSGTNNLLLLDAPGISSMSSLWGYSYNDITQNVDYLPSLLGLPLAFSTIAVEPGLFNVENYASVFIPPNQERISTVQVLASTASFFLVNTDQFSTLLLSTPVVSSQFVYTSSLITFTGFISSFFAPLTAITNKVNGNVLTTSSLSTSHILISSVNGINAAGTFKASSLNIYNSNVYFSSVSAGVLYASSINFGRSTLFASNGVLCIQYPTPIDGVTFKAFTASGGTTDFFKYPRGISVPMVYVSTIFTSTTVLSTTLSSFTLDVQAIISSASYETQISQLIVRPPKVSTFLTLGGYDTWNIVANGPGGFNVGDVQMQTGGLNFMGHSQINCRNLPIVIAATYSDHNKIFPASNITSTFTGNTGNTYVIEWDGRKLLVGGGGDTNGNALVAYNVTPSFNLSNAYCNAYSIRDSLVRSPVTYVGGDAFTCVRGIAYNGNMYVAVGTTIAAKSIKYSYDGLKWNGAINDSFFYTVPNSNLYNAGGHCVAWNGSMWLVGGSNTQLQMNPFRNSYNGVVWNSSGFSGFGDQYCSAQRLVYFNNSVWVCGGQFSDCNLKYSYDGFNWSNCVYPNGTTFINSIVGQNCRLLIVTPTYVIAGFDSNWAPARSRDGINFTTFGLYSNTNPFNSLPCGLNFGDGVFDGNSILVPGAGYTLGTTPAWDVGFGGFGTTIGQSGANAGKFFITPMRHLSGTSQNGSSEVFFNLYSQNISLAGEGRFVNQTNQWSGERMPFAARSNIIPTMKMSNLEIYGNTYINIYKSTNTIVGYQNYPLIQFNVHLEKMNSLMFNNTLKIIRQLSTQVSIASPDNPNTAGFNNPSLPRATLDVMCTINVRNITDFTKFRQIPAPFYPSTVGPNDQSYDFYVTGSTFMTNLAVGGGFARNNYVSTPQSFFDIYNGASNSFVTFREMSNNDALAVRLLNSIPNQSNVTCYPMVTGSNGNLIYYFKNNNQVYKATDTVGTTYFTGQHPTNCLNVNYTNIADHVGQLVSIANEGCTMYDTSGVQISGKNAVQITSAAPITKLTTTDMDPQVFGVVANSLNNGMNADGSLDTYSDSMFQTNLFGRIMVNCIGEGALWVTNYGGNVSNGDYLCSSPIPGLSRRQNDGRLRNYTVAKATMSCDFNPGFVSSISTFICEGSTLSTVVSCLSYKCESIEFNGSTFLKAFIGCTYHCS